MCAAVWVESNLRGDVTLSSPIKLLLDTRYWSRVFYTKIYSFNFHNNLKCYAVLSLIQLFVTPWTVAHQAPHPWEFSRQGYWSGLPFPTPGDLPNPGIKPRSPMLQVDSLPAEPPGKPKNTAVGSLSLLQGIFLTQELNWGLQHCGHILYHLRCQGSPSAPQFAPFKQYY